MEGTRAAGSPKMMNQCIPRLAKPPPKAKPRHHHPASLLERFREAVLRMIMLSAVSRSTREGVDRDRPRVAPFTPSGHARPHHRQPSYCTHYQDRYYGEAVADCIEFIKKTASGDEENDCRSVAAADMVVSVQVA